MENDDEILYRINEQKRKQTRSAIIRTSIATVLIILGFISNNSIVLLSCFIVAGIIILFSITSSRKFSKRMFNEQVENVRAYNDDLLHDGYR